MYRIIGADQKEYGPVSTDELRQWIAQGRANGQTLVRLDDTPWRPLATFPEFAADLSGQPGLPPDSPTLPPAINSLRQSGGATPKTNAMALTGLILGIVSVTFGLCCCYGIPFNVLGIVFSLIGLAQIRKNPELETGKGLAIAGLVLSSLSIVLVGMLIAIGVAGSAWEIFDEIRKGGQ
ncbi:MAG TPA: DUF4190 domain-containing protein [Verrucomicrobiae bacterium]|nr:DUF4190 domain-containing protein [Verrucomicrobiae bacterium]